MIPATIVGFVLGVAASASAAWFIARRAVHRARLAERRARTSERLAEIGSMTGGLAHEIRNPLSTIALNAQLLREAIGDLKADDDERARLDRRIASLQRETERLRGILEDFLQFAGELRIEAREQDVNSIVEELADFFGAQAEADGVRLRVQLAPGPLTAAVDAAHLKQALLNLMLNAVQAMRGREPPRELLLRTSQSDDPSRSPARKDQAARRAREIVIHVIDTGPGIALEVMARLFQPYFSTKAGGTGLGLATSRRIVEAHGGRLEVHSEVGKGTEFRVVLEASG